MHKWTCSVSRTYGSKICHSTRQLIESACFVRMYFSSAVYSSWKRFYWYGPRFPPPSPSVALSTCSCHSASVHVLSTDPQSHWRWRCDVLKPQWLKAVWIRHSTMMFGDPGGHDELIIVQKVVIIHVFCKLPHCLAALIIVKLHSEPELVV
jgi:hypothetical protein